MQPQDTTQPTFIKLGKNAKDITGQRFGRLVALGPVRTGKKNELMWYCQCDCGNFTTVRPDSLTRKQIQSCDCLRIERSVAASKKHGMSGTSTYALWSRIIQRCHNPDHPRYHDYGGRGIEICQEWRDSFDLFRSHISNLPNYGEKGYSLDRVNNSLGYFPGNVRFATRFEQAQNTRTNRSLTFNDKTQCLSAWERELGLRTGQLWERLERGWSAERAVTTSRNGKSQANSASPTSCI